MVAIGTAGFDGGACPSAGSGLAAKLSMPATVPTSNLRPLNMIMAPHNRENLQDRALTPEHTPVGTRVPGKCHETVM
jgi:hypothetical protein